MGIFKRIILYTMSWDCLGILISLGSVAVSHNPMLLDSEIIVVLDNSYPCIVTTAFSWLPGNNHLIKLHLTCVGLCRVSTRLRTTLVVWNIQITLACPNRACIDPGILRIIFIYFNTIVEQYIKVTQDISSSDSVLEINICWCVGCIARSLKPDPTRSSSASSSSTFSENAQPAIVRVHDTSVRYIFSMLSERNAEMYRHCKCHVSCRRHFRQK